jgi:hypothetical protein
VDSRVEGSKPLHQDSRGHERRSPEIAKESEPFDWKKDTCREITHIGDSDIGVREGSLLTSESKSREDRDCPSEEDRWQRSKDLANSEVRKVRAQELGAPSHECESREEQRQPLDPGRGRTIGSEPHRAYRAFRGSEVGRTSSRHQKSRSAESRGTSVDMWQNHKVGPA